MSVTTPRKLKKQAEEAGENVNEYLREYLLEYGVAGAAKELGVSRGAIYHWLNANQLKVEKTCRCVYTLVPAEVQ